MSFLPFYAAFNLLNSLSEFSIALFAFFSPNRTVRKRILACWMFSLGIWSLGVGMHAITASPNMAMFWSRFLHVGAIIIPVIYLHLAMVLTGKNSPRLLKTLYGTSIIYLCFLPTALMVREVSPIGPFEYFPKAGLLYHFYVLQFIVCIILALFILGKKVITSIGYERNQVKFIFFGSLIAYATGPTAFLYEYDIPIFPVGTPLVLLNSLVISYAILRHRLMDIQLLSRNITGWVFTVLLSVLPFLMGFLVVKCSWSLASVPPLITAILFAVMGTFVYWMNKTSRVNRIYALFCWNTFFWQINCTILFNTNSETLAGLLVKLVYTGIIFLPVVFYHLIIAFAGDFSALKRLPYTYGIGGLFAISVWLPNIFLRGYYHYHWGFYPKAGILHPVYLIFLTILVIQGLFMLRRSLYASDIPPNRRTQTRFFLCALGIYVLASVDFLVNYGINFYPFGFVFTLISIGLITHAILRHQLMDIQLLGHNITGWLVVVSLSCFSFGMGVLLAQRSWLAPLGGFLGGLFLAYLLKTLHQPVQEWVDQTFPFRKEFGHVVKAIQSMKKEWNLDSLEEALPLVCRGVLESAPYRACTIAIMFDEQPKRPFFRSTYLRLAKGELIPGMLWSEPLVLAFLQLVRQNGNLCLREEISNIPPLIEELEPLLFEAAVPLTTNGKIVGAVVMGPKEKRTASFHDEDVKILNTLAQTLSQRLGPSVGLNLFRCVVNNTLHDVLGQDIGPLVDKLSLGYPVTQDMTLGGLRRTRDVLKELRAYAQGELEKGRAAQPGMFNIEYIIKGVYELHKDAAEKKGLKFHLKIPVSLPRLRLDPILVERCVANLVTNAIKYTLQGAIEISVQMDEKILAVNVADTGIGIPKESLPRLFEAGYRVPGESALIAEGTGIGLANVKDLMVALGGRVEVKSEFGRGSRFYLYFPLPAEITEVQAVT